MRSVLERALVERVLNPQIEVDSLSFHSAASVLEARGLRWSIGHQDRTCRLSAKRLWLAVETQPLLERRFLAPAGVLEDARLDVNLPSQPNRASDWREALARPLQEFEWPRLRTNFEALQSAEDLALDWETRITRWLDRSREIVAQSQALEDEARAITNALRFEQEIRSRMNRIEALGTEQGLLVNQLSGIRQLLDAETMRLQRMRTNELQWLEGHPLDCDDSRYAEVARIMLVEQAEQVWHKYAPLAEIADILSSASQVVFSARTPRPVSQRQRDGLDYDVRRVDLARPFVDLRSLTARGMLVFQGQDQPFVFHGDVEVHHTQLPSRPGYRSEFRYGLPQGSIHVSTAREENASSSTIRLTRVDEGADDAADCLAAAIDIESTESGIDGTLQIRRASLDQSELSGFLKSADSGLEEGRRPVELQVSGTWEEPRLELVAETPKWLIAAIAHDVSNRSTQARTDAAARYLDEFQTALDRLQTVANESAVEGQRLVELHRDQLVAARGRLQAETKRKSAAAVGPRTAESIDR